MINKTMEKKMKKQSLALLLLAVSSVSYAEGEKVQHGAHVHGVADMNIVWDKKALNIELMSPSYNILGFGHKPTNHEQEETIEKAEKKLNLPNELFGFVGSSCKVVKTNIESPFENHEGHDDKDDHDEHAKHEDHGDKGGHDEHAKHEDHDEHDHKEGEKSSHSEYNVHYEFSCTDSKEGLTVATANIFKYFPNMEKIKVQWLSATQQSSSILTKKDNTLKLK